MLIQIPSVTELYKVPGLVCIALFNADTTADTESIELEIGGLPVPVSMSVTWQFSDTPEYSGWSEGAEFSLSFTGASLKHYGEASYRLSVETPEPPDYFHGFLSDVSNVVSQWVALYAAALENSTETLEER